MAYYAEKSMVSRKGGWCPVVLVPKPIFARHGTDRGDINTNRTRYEVIIIGRLCTTFHPCGDGRAGLLPSPSLTP